MRDGSRGWTLPTLQKLERVSLYAKPLAREAAHMAGKNGVTPLRSVERAAEHGSRRDLLVALRDKLWEAFHDERTQPRDLSPLTLRLKELQAEIDAIDQADEHEIRVVEDAPFNPEDI